MSTTENGSGEGSGLAAPIEPVDEVNDEAIIEQINRIQDEVNLSQELVCAKEDITSMQADYVNDVTGTDTYLSKAKELATRYVHLRKVRGDGNCFYRALIFAQIEFMLNNKAEYERFHKLASTWKARLVKLGFPEFTSGDFCDEFMGFVDKIGTGEMDQVQLESGFNDANYSNYIIAFLRLATAGYLQENEEFFSNFVDGERTLKEYCAQEVEPMFKTCDHLTITAMTQALGLSFRIEYLDRTEAPEGNWHHDFRPDSAPPTADLNLFFLYRHDHYDILYPKPKE